MAINAFGTQFLMGDNANPEVFTAVAEVADIQGPNFAKEAIEVTHHGSTDGWRERISGLKDGGEVTLTLNFDPQGATHDADTGLLSQLFGDDVSNYQIILPDTDATVFEFAAVATGFTIVAPVDDKLSADVTLMISGVVSVDVSGS